jgi:hypothetical protein
MLYQRALEVSGTEEKKSGQSTEYDKPVNCRKSQAVEDKTIINIWHM